MHSNKSKYRVVEGQVWHMFVEELINYNYATSRKNSFNILKKFIFLHKKVLKEK
jgi:hypothetical protein